jgi:hypothetical protein
MSGDVYILPFLLSADRGLCSCHLSLLCRCAEGVQGLQQQVLANGLTAKLIELYNVFFLEDNEVSPYSDTYRFPKVSH